MKYDYLITGCSSPIGNYLINKIIAKEPLCKILAIGRNPPKVYLDNIDFIRFDFTNPFSYYIKMVSDICVDKIIHLASLTPGNINDNKDQVSYINGNVNNVIKLFVEIINNSKFLKIFFLSSTAVYDRTENQVIFECSTKTNSDYYGVSKLILESEICVLSKIFNLSTLGIRIPVLLCDDVSHNFMSKWRNLINNNEKITITNPDSLFNAVCPSWVIYSIMEKFFSNNTKIEATISNVFASEYTTLMSILQTINYDNIEILNSNNMPQLISTKVSDFYLPDYSAHEEVLKFLLRK